MNDTIKNLIERISERCGDGDVSEVRELVDTYEDLKLLISIGRSISSERNLEKLLRMILQVSKMITAADAGSIFLVEEDGEGTRLRFKYSHTFSKQLDYEEFTMKRDTSSIAGYVSIKGEVLNIADAYDLDPSLPFHFNSKYDIENGYQTRSILVVPMKNHLEEVIGVIQLINSKENLEDPAIENSEHILLATPEDFQTKVIPFKQKYDQIMVAVANQAAISIENSRMIRQIEEQFEAFVKASAYAIESRDPATSGHSSRVAKMAVAMAKAISEEIQGPYAKIVFNHAQVKELEFAGLLHDFGKVYLDPSVFLKAKKLYPRDYDYLILRLNYLYRCLELGYTEHELELVGKTEAEKIEGIRAEKAEALQELLAVETLVTMLNEPSVQSTDPEGEISRLLAKLLPDFCTGIRGEPVPLLTEEEAKNLRIRKGSLNDEERKIIQSHVTYTYTFVSRIPWPPDFKNIPEYAYKHHEMLDGSGYPQGLTAGGIPLQARILAVADVYDALAASDRPYKKALPPEKVYAILREEGEKGKLDAEVVRIFLEAKAYEACKS